MKRVKRVFTHQRHWLWGGVVCAFSVAEAILPSLDGTIPHGPFMLLTAFAMIGAFVAKRCAPPDVADAA